jgi:23S rRNA-/tRNA-specific pseudouridylate synthase/SAM-dependent methyltransferase
VRAEWRPIGQGVRLVHVDDDIMIVDKPAGILTSTIGTQTGDNVFGVVKQYVRGKARGRPPRIFIIHRLDKEASGLLVFALSDPAYAWLKEDFRTKRVQRIYHAVVEGGFESPPGATQQAMGTIQSILYEDERGIMHSVDSTLKVPRQPQPPSHARGDDDRNASDPSVSKPAVTHYRVLQQGHGRSLLQVKLDTGRKNQIRVHMQSIGRPIVGDRRYGAKTDPLGRVCLHASELGLTHPHTGKTLRFVSPTPGGFQGLVGATASNTPTYHVTPSPSPAESSPVAQTTARVVPPTASAASVPASSAGAALTGSRTREPAPNDSSVGTSWDHVAEWYDDLLDDRGSDHHERVILPGLLRLLGSGEGLAGKRVLDVACGQGLLTRRFTELGATTTGVDASPKLVRTATSNDPRSTYLVGDARSLDALGLAAPFDAITCVMALMNIDPLASVMRGVASLLAPRGVFVAIILHPAFRAPGQTSWGWDVPPATPRQYRRVDGYLSPVPREIVMNPGAVANGKPAVTTVTHHRPLQQYVRGLADAGLLVDVLEEWPSQRTSQPGPRASEENRARREIPMFAAIRAVLRA